MFAIPRIRLLAGAFLSIVAMLSPSLSRAQDTNAAQRVFVDRYVAAIKLRDEVALKRLYHPAVLGCVTLQNRDFFDFMFAQEFAAGPHLAGGYTIARIDAVASDRPPIMPDMFAYPVPPTHEFQIDTPPDKKNRSLSLLRTIAPFKGAWYVVQPCPNAKGIAVFRERQSDGGKQQAHAHDLADALQDPLLSDLKELLAEGQRIEAIKRYKAAADVDLTTAKLVIDVLDGD